MAVSTEGGEEGKATTMVEGVRGSRETSRSRFFDNFSSVVVEMSRSVKAVIMKTDQRLQCLGTEESVGASSFSQSVVVLTWRVEEKGQAWSLKRVQPSTTLVILGYNRPPLQRPDKSIVHILDAIPKYSYKLLYYIPIIYLIRVQNQLLMSMFCVVPPPLLGYLSDFARRQVLSGRY